MGKMPLLTLPTFSAVDAAAATEVDEGEVAARLHISFESNDVRILLALPDGGSDVESKVETFVVGVGKSICMPTVVI